MKLILAFGFMERFLRYKMIIIDEITKRQYRVVRCDRIKKGDLFPADNMRVMRANVDYPQPVRSYILEEIVRQVPESVW
jgi:hypothetical protein